MLRALLLSTALLFLPLLAPSASAAESAAGNPIVLVKTSEGDITLRLFVDKAPVTVANFLGYVDAGFYKGTIFHRVIPDFMIQGGGLLADMSEKETGEPIANESRNRLHNERGTIAMARLNDPDSATVQFFINVRNNLRLDWAPGRDGYTVFGEVIDGMKVVDYIATAPTGNVGGHNDVPLEPIKILDVVRQ
ncbi:peptidyl-prolyl cis-trans isomerase [Mangrovimicrobium sediminis]|uniref:Peptidyl-prolyl cis-trans isomerase n=1 Tax=Mangrovimicrobium sediminis TaxID=2562682 RepID=A0A4Z0M1N5_9GAMM|nr:peptidylprolyl isomerase [Haliea sp. SAOS-164]TGD73451.1 peptidyl-prolyl cis-trans isomerase [Haliea sp. SAOS-164]